MRRIWYEVTKLDIELLRLPPIKPRKSFDDFRPYGVFIILAPFTYFFFQAVDDSEASKRTETAAEAQGLNVNPWTADEQKLLEQALKTYPSSLGSERWEKISSCIPDRSKKDCMRR